MRRRMRRRRWARRKRKRRRTWSRRRRRGRLRGIEYFIIGKSKTLLNCSKFSAQRS